ncbi:MAG: 16S rRNA (cytosine(1402)-N(4))-methyltransferase RsmH [Candidatus Kerfeldbacteria bacterium]|nr:16S rRNA (cytosine(1402)-N(4))-methyltransferase RsmH [Candidatus Kerfeldbacteria bacterium]
MPGHVPVLFSDVLQHLQLKPNDNAIDATLGGGGHTRGLLEATAPNGRVLGLEADPRTLEQTKLGLLTFGSRFVPVHGNFSDLELLATRQGFDQVDAILFDLGLSSIALDDASRGFSFQRPGPLDMRFDPTTDGLTAADLISTASTEKLIRLFETLGQESRARSIATAIVQRRQQKPIETTTDLADLVERVKPRRSRIHPATKVFQALRMAVNDELGVVERALPQALQLLRPGGRLAVITFHSGEDRLVKTWSHQAAKVGQLKLMNKHVIVPTRAEQKSNPRTRSAKLRVIEKK